MKIHDPDGSWQTGAAVGVGLLLLSLLMPIGGAPAPIDHQLDALRASLVVRFRTAGAAAFPEASTSGPETTVIVSIYDRTCCLDDGIDTACGSAVQLGEAACRGREVRHPLPCGALAFCGGGDE